MRITWHIEKQRGNLRPVLTYAVALEGCEKELALRLPWREDNRYPEVEDSFRELRRAFEAALAHASEPMDQRGELALTQALRRELAPAVMAERLLRLAKQAV